MDVLEIVHVIYSIVLGWLTINAYYPHVLPPLRGESNFMEAFICSWLMIELGAHIGVFSLAFSLCLIVYEGYPNEMAHFDTNANLTSGVIVAFSLCLNALCSIALIAIYLTGFFAFKSSIQQISSQMKEYVRHQPDKNYLVDPNWISKNIESGYKRRYFWRELLFPFRWHRNYHGLVCVDNDISYGPAVAATGDPAHTLDVYYPSSDNHHLMNQSVTDMSALVKPRMIVIAIHGGAWVSGSRSYSSLPLLYKLTAFLGCVCFNIDYRLCNDTSPNVAWPHHLTDCEMALDWIAANAHRWNGDPNFIILTGGSAGAHLATLLAFQEIQRSQLASYSSSHNKNNNNNPVIPFPRRIRACIPYYGVYNLMLPGNRKFFSRRVLKRDDPEILEQSSPQILLERKHFLYDPASFPSFLCVQGMWDSITPHQHHSQFVEQLRTFTSNQALITSLDIPFAQHAFDVFGCPRSLAAVFATIDWLQYLYHIENEK